MRRTFLIVGAIAVVLGTPRMAAADITGFVGLMSNPENRFLRGFAVGVGVLVIGFEFEYGDTIEDEEASSPSLRTGSGNVLVQTPEGISAVQLYGTIGGGLYRERLLSRQETSFSTNLGGGAKIRLAGPLRLRLDYRVFQLRGEPLNDTYQRFYAGANLAF